MHLPRWLLQLAAAGAAAFAAAVGTTLVLAIVDIYLTGHSRPSLMRDWISYPPLGIELSRAAVLMYLVALGAGVVVWFRLRRGS